jgi:hypothetical protein
MFEAVRLHIFPFLRTEDVISRFSLMARADAPAPGTPIDIVDFVWRPVCEGLALFYVLDKEQTFQFVTSTELREWGVSEAELFSCAMANLRAATWGVPRKLETSSVYMSGFADGYDATRAVLHE